MSVFCDQGDGYNLDFDSDDGGSCSSESGNELDIILHGTPEQKRKLRRESEGGNPSDDESDFEKEMDMELNRTVQGLEQKRGPVPMVSSTSKDAKGSASKSKTSASYDNDGFDSGSDEDEEGEDKKKNKQPVLSNDDLLYDPDQDDDNQRWVDNMRQKHRPTSSNKNKARPAPQSDAVLNCPACMITLCVDCQRHDLYKNQYRAMFVMNCNVNNSEVLRYPKENGKKKKKARKRKHEPEPQEETSGRQAQGLDDNEVYHPVKCTECTTEVAVMDSDEVYHFFNVLASYA